MSDSSARTFSSDFRRFFLRGLVIVLPSVLTLWIVVAAYEFVDRTIAEPINAGIRFTLAKAAPHWSALSPILEPSEQTITEETDRRLAAGAMITPEEVRAEMREKIRTDPAARRAQIGAWWNQRRYMNVIGLLVAIIAVYIAGRLLGGFFGRRIYRKLEDVITSLPVVKQVYPYVKQIVDFLFSDDRPIKFNRVVAIEYPRKGVWSVGFATGGPMRSIEARAGTSITVFVPSSPTPFTGYTITVPREDTIELPISVEEAIRFAVSGGVLVPDHQRKKTTLDADGSSELPDGLIPIPGPGGPPPAEPPRAVAPPAGGEPDPAPTRRRSVG
jgi:uncharacterized membrane protein